MANSLTYQNVIYDSCYEGFDCIHLNGWETGRQVVGNIVSYSGYPGLHRHGAIRRDGQWQSLFDDASECVLLYDYTNYYGVANFSANSTSMTITAVPSVGGAPANWPGTVTTMYVYGPGLPAGPPPAGATFSTVASGSVAGTYTLSTPTLAAGSSVPVSMGGNNSVSNNPGPSTLRWDAIENNICEQGNPSDLIYGGNPELRYPLVRGDRHHLYQKHQVTGNTIATYNADAGVGQMPLAFLVGSAQSGGAYTQPH